MNPLALIRWSAVVIFPPATLAILWANRRELDENQWAIAALVGMCEAGLVFVGSN